MRISRPIAVIRLQLIERQEGVALEFYQQPQEQIAAATEEREEDLLEKFPWGSLESQTD